MSEDRKKEIRDLLSARGYMTVEELSKQLFVSVPTIRRDLNELSRKGLVKRVHGGASYVGKDSFEWSLDLRNRVNLGEKKRIGQKAAELIEDGNHLFLDAGTTCHFLARALKPSIKISVLTNSIPTMQKLSENKNIIIECPCGLYVPSHLGIFGDEAASFIQTRHADFYFATATGFHEETGVTLRTRLEISVKQAMRKNSDCMVLLLDHSKMGIKNYYHTFDFSQIDILITDAPLSASLAEKCADQGVDVIYA
ncbi:MAG: DeoR/GlpR family DNA-binding transcription regulator [Lachnospiraceae bacterium]|nr:DeoR/GlpR family DNA-binding transcription regulator [Lachnospiraceae bacterium]